MIAPSNSPRSGAARDFGGGGLGDSAQLEESTDTPRVGPSRRRAAVVLLSGGLDSATTLAVARAEGRDCHALTIDYGQRHRAEIEAARRVAVDVGAVEHKVVPLDLTEFGGSALTDAIPVPHPDDPDAIGSGIPPTYVPARNTILLSLALAWAEILDVRDIYIGANVRDFSGYPDCRPAFLDAFQALANLATRAGVEGDDPFEIHAPLLYLTKAEIIERGAELDVNFALTHSCYDPTESGRACGLCEACILRRQGFRAAGVEDPTPYAD